MTWMARRGRVKAAAEEFDTSIAGGWGTCCFDYQETCWWGEGIMSYGEAQR